MLIQSTFGILSMVLAVRILGFNGQNQKLTQTLSIIIPMRFEDFDILINKGFLNDTRRIWCYIACSTIRGNMQRFTSEEEDERGCENGRKSF